MSTVFLQSFLTRGVFLKLVSKVLLCILASAIILFCGFFVLLVVALGGAGTFYQTLVVVGAVILWLFMIMQIWQLLKPKVRYILIAAAVAVMVLAAMGFEINKAYHNSFDEVNEQGVDLSLYEPFREDTLAVSLEETATTRIQDNPPRIDGAIALYPLYSAFARAVYPHDADGVYEGDVEAGTIVPQKVDSIVACTNTDGAYRRLIAGEADIIFVAGPSEGQLQMAEEANVELILTPIGREAFVFFVNAKNPVNSLSINDIQRIYSGEAKNWREFGGKSSTIRAFQRPENSGSQTALVSFMGDIPLMTPPKEDVASGMGGIISRVSSYKNYDNAIGYSFLFFATEMVHDNKIKLLALNGVAPTRENVANRTYPYAAEFYAVTAGTENPNAEILIEWILSGQGQYLVNKTGYTPLMDAGKDDN